MNYFRIWAFRGGRQQETKHSLQWACDDFLDFDINTGVGFRRELRESIWILLRGVCKSLWILLRSVLCENIWTVLRESNWTLVDSFVGVFARVDSWTLAEILTL